MAIIENKIGYKLSMKQTILLCLMFISLITSSCSITSADEGLILFDVPEETIKESSFKVIQVIDKGMALVRGKETSKDKDYYGVVYLIRSSSHYFTDDEIIDAPKGTVFKQIGVYSYNTQGGEIFGFKVESEKRTVKVISLYNE